MLTFNDNGIYCAAADVYIDPWRPVDHAIITHAHSDHARWGMKKYLAHHDALPVLRLRLGEDINVQGIPYDEVVSINGVKISLHPAGHIWGSAQVRLEYKGEVWVVSGDYKLQPDGVSAPFEAVKCHHFITESTFGLPVYKFPDPQIIHDDINAWWRKNMEEGRNSVLMGYALGKAQRMMKYLDPSIGDIYTHGAIHNINKLYESIGGTLPPNTYWGEVDVKKVKGAMIVAPPSAAGTAWIRKLKPYRTAICSGWMQLRGTRRRRSVDTGFVLSDHADWNELNTAIKATGAENVYVTHGYKSVFAKWLRDEYKLNATEVDTLYTGEELDSTDEKEGGDEGVQ